MYEDSVLKELREVKDRIAAEHGYDIRKLIEALREKQEKEGRKVVSPPPRPVAG